MPRSVHTDDYKRLIGLLVAARRAAGITQTDLARSLAKPQSYVSKIENGERRLDVVEFCDWVSALGTDPPSLLADFLR
jgi:transcriptional regulator with XRE-family HTH domain